MLEGVDKFCEEINLSDSFAKGCQKFKLGLIILLAPCQGSNLIKFFDRCPEIMDNLKQLKPMFCTIFRENSIKLRRRLFQEPLMRHLWEMFRTNKGDLIKEYISSLRTKESEDVRTASNVLLSDIMNIEQDAGIKILP